MIPDGSNLPKTIPNGSIRYEFPKIGSTSSSAVTDDSNFLSMGSTNICDVIFEPFACFLQQRGQINNVKNWALQDSIVYSVRFAEEQCIKCSNADIRCLNVRGPNVRTVGPCMLTKPPMCTCLNIFWIQNFSDDTKRFEKSSEKQFRL